MKNFNFFDKLFGTVGSPNQTDETQTRENRVGLMSYLRRTLMLFFALLVMSIANIGTAWGTDITWNFGSSSVSISNGSSSDFTADDGSSVLRLNTAGSGDAIDGTAPNKYCKMNGKSVVSSSLYTSRYFSLKAPSAAGKFEFSFNSKAANIYVVTGTSKNILLASVAGEASKVKQTSVITNLTAGTTDLYIGFDAAVYFNYIKWIPADNPEDERIYYSEVKSTMTTGASLSSSSASQQTGGSGVYADYSYYYKTGSSGGSVTITFDPVLSLNSNGSDRGRVRVHYGKQGFALYLNGGASSVATFPSITTSNVPSLISVVDYTISDDTTTIKSIKLQDNSGASGGFWCAVEVLTYTPSCEELDAPTGLSCTNIWSNNLTFGWTAVANADHYTATLYSDAECNTQVKQNTSISGTSTTFRDITPNTTYYCKVQSHGNGSTYCEDGGTTATAASAKTLEARIFKSGEYIYFKDASGPLPFSGGSAYWKQSGGNLCAYFFDDASPTKNSAWATALTMVSGSSWNDKNNIYRIIVPQLDSEDHEWTGVIFTRASEYDSWTFAEPNFWEQTEDQRPALSYNLFKINNDAADGKWRGTWARYTEDPTLVGDFNGWEPTANVFGNYSSNVGSTVFTLDEASTNYKFKILDGEKEWSYDASSAGWTITNTTTTSQQLYDNNDVSNITSTEVGEYVMKYNKSTHTFIAAYYPKDRLTKNTILYFDGRRETNWQSAPYHTKFYFKKYDSDSELEISPSYWFSESPVEDWVYYITLPNSDNIGKVQIMRMNPNKHSEQWCYANLINAGTRSSVIQNCLTEQVGSESAVNTWTPGWQIYCPPTTSETFTDNSTSVIAGTSGDGTSGSPYLVPTTGTIKVQASASKAVADGNMTINYDFKVDDSSAQPGEGNTYSKGSLSNNTTYKMSVDVYTVYNLDDSKNSTKHTPTELYYKALNVYTISYNKGSNGTGDNTTAEKIYGISKTLLGVTFTRTGYTQTAWNTDPSGTGGTSYSLSGSYTGNADVTLYPTWTAKTTTITIDDNDENHGSTTPGTVTATYGSALPSFTAAAGESGYSLTGYFTAATEGDKIINADGTLVRNTTYSTDESTPKWKSEAATLTLFAQYEEEVVSPSKCITFNSTSAPSVSGVTIKKVAGRDGGSTYTENGFFMSKSGDYITFDISALGNLTKATFTAKTNSNSKKIGYGYTDAASYVGEVPSSGTSDTEFHEYEITSIPDNTTRFTLVRRGTGTTITEVCLFYTPISCSTPAAPSSLTNGATTTNTQVVTWTANDEDTWEVYHSTSSSTPGTDQTPTATVTSATYTFTGLTASTQYYWWARSKCDASHKSSWVAGTSFTTSAATYTLTATAKTNMDGAFTGSTTITNSPVSSVTAGTTIATSDNTFTVGGSTTVAAPETIAGTVEVDDDGAPYDAPCTWRFSKWNNIVTPVAGDESDIEAEYVPTFAINYTLGEGGTINESYPNYYIYTGDEEDEISLPTDVTKANYIFDHWEYQKDKSISTITCDNFGIFNLTAFWTAKTSPGSGTVSGTTSICSGDNTDITLSASVSGASYQLYKGEDKVGDAKAGTGSALTWSVSEIGTYTVKAVETATHASGDMSGSAVISASTATSISTQPTTAVSGHDGVDFTLGSGLVATGEGTLTYQWYSYTSSDGAGQATVGSATTTKTLTTSKAAGTYYYKVEVIGTCGEEKSDMITVTVDNKHLLTYDANGGEGAPDAIYKSSGNMTLSSTEPTRDGYRFLGWNTENDGTGDHYDAGGTYKMGSTAVTLYAEWGETATLTWTLTTGTGESSVSTSSKTSTNTTRISTSNMSNLSNSGLTITNNSKTSYTVKIEAPSSKDDDKYMYVTFVVADDYELVPSAVTATFQPVDAAASADMILSDTHGHSISLLGASCSKGDPNEKTITNDGDVAFSGTVTLKIYCYGSSVNTYRLGSTITVTGDINYICPERATITSPTAPQSIKLYTDESKTLSVSATAYAGTLNYQWQKDGVDIDGATLDTYTVDGSGLTAGTTYAYTCNISETEPASCATVTSPAFNITAASPDCGWNVIAGATRKSGSTNTMENATGVLYGGSGVSCESTGKLGSNGHYMYITLKSGEYLQNGDKVVININTVGGIGDGSIHLFAGTTSGSTEIGTKASPSVGDNEVTLSNVPNNTASVTMYRTSDNQNHKVDGIKVKRYTCPDIKEFLPTGDDGNWNATANWIGATGRGASLPTIDDRVIISKPVTVDIADAKAQGVLINQYSGATGKVTVSAGKALIIADKLQKTTTGSNRVATAAADVIINSDRTTNGVGALVIGGETGTNKATVNFETKAKNDGGWVNQFIGSPFSDNEPYVDYAIQLYKFEPRANGDRGWWWTHSSGTMTPFWGYNVLYNDASELDVTWTGTMNASESKTISGLYYNGSSETDNMFANSWTAPIHVGEIEEDDIVNASKTLYMFNAGTPAQEAGHSDADATNSNEAPGTYISIPIHSAPYAGIGVIPSMQAFYVEAQAAEASITLDYNKVVYTPALKSVGIVPNRAPKHNAEVVEPEVIKLHVQSETGWGANTYVMGRADFAEGYEDGWDGAYIEGESATPKLYTPSIDGDMFINCLPQIDGTVVGFRKGSDDSAYTFSFKYDGEDEYYLKDLKLDIETRIDNDHTYFFTTEDGDSATRFIIVRKTPAVATGSDNVDAEAAQVRKFIIDNKVYIIRGGRMYNATGALVK